MSKSMFDVLKEFSTDIQAQVGFPAIAQSDIPTDSASIRFKLNNPTETPRELSGPLTELKGEINVQISHKLGSSDFTMYALAELVSERYKRPHMFGTTQVDYVRTSSVYTSESNAHINVIIGFIAISA
jgi:hypothetical protein